MKKYIKIIPLCFIIILSIIATAFPAYGGGVTVNGDTAPPGGGGGTPSSGGFGVHRVGADKREGINAHNVGWRFSVVDANGITKYKPKDVFRDTTYGNEAYDNQYYKFETKYNKRDSIAHKTAAFKTIASNTGCVKAADTGLDFRLVNGSYGSRIPTTYDMTEWLGKEDNINKIATIIGVPRGKAGLVKGDRILAEPIFALMIDSSYHALTVSEIGRYGRWYFGENAGTSTRKDYGASWGWIANRTNGEWPGSYYTGDGQLLEKLNWGATSYDSKNKPLYPFKDLIEKGFGVGVAYMEENNPATTVWINNCEVKNIENYNTNSAVQKDIGYSDGTSYHQNSGMYYLSAGCNGWFQVGFGSSNWNADVTRTITTTSIGWNGNTITSHTVSETGTLNTFRNQEWYVIGKGEANYQMTPVPQNVKEYKITATIQANDGSGAKATKTFIIPTSFTPNLNVELCEVWPGNTSDRSHGVYGWSTGYSFDKYVYKNGYPQKDDKIWFCIKFPQEAQPITVKQTVWLDGAQYDTRTSHMDLGKDNWYATKATITADKKYYTVKARMDWVDLNGNVLKYGTEKEFYIPIQPTTMGTQVTAYNYAGDVQAQSTLANIQGTGKMYYGQQVQFQYKYEGRNTWESLNAIRCIPKNWSPSLQKFVEFYNGNKWYEDVQQNNVTLSNTISKTVDSAMGKHRIPLPEAPIGWDRYRFDLRTVWNNLWGKADNTNVFYLEVVKADVELAEIRLVDEDGYYVDPERLKPGTKITPQYTYKNNTDCTVFVEGSQYESAYENPTIRLKGVYCIDPKSSTVVNGESFVVPEKSYNYAKGYYPENIFSVWAGVGLEGMVHDISGYSDDLGIDTSYESNGENNFKTLHCSIVSGLDPNDLELVPITPNAPYREGTEVMTSYWLINHGPVDVTPDDDVQLLLRADCGANGLRTESTQVVVPANDKNIVYVKWSVPAGLNHATVKGDACLLYKSQQYKPVSKDYDTIPYDVYDTPDTQYEEKKPSGFTAPTDSPTSPIEVADWSEWQYEGGRFVKKHYQFNLDDTNRTYDFESAKNPSMEHKNGGWYIKSGYGFGVKAKVGVPNRYSWSEMAPPAGISLPDSSRYTNPQYAYVTFPEFNYAYGPHKSRTLEKIGDYFVFRVNGSYGRVHFTPLWYPDGYYLPVLTQSDMWTPAGMIKSAKTIGRLEIKGSAYDDWYTGHRS